MTFNTRVWPAPGRLAAITIAIVGLNGLIFNAPVVADDDGLSCRIEPRSVTINSGESVDFRGSADHGRTPYTFSWSFEGGNPASAGNVTEQKVEYAKSGQYSARMNVRDRRGNTCRATASVTVKSGSTGNTPPAVTNPGPQTSAEGQQVALQIQASDANGDSLTYSASGLPQALAINSGTGLISGTIASGAAAASPYAVTVKVSDGKATTSLAIQWTVTAGQQVSGVSINSTSQSCGTADPTGLIACPETAVDEEPVPNQANSLNPAPGTGDRGYQIVAINDLGMHCGDLDTRISSILPPFQVLLAQVIRKGREPQLLGPGEVDVVYSAASNPNDPILSAADPFTGITPNGDVYKTNFWKVISAYDPFYPPGVLCTDPANSATCSVSADNGLPVPNVENLYIGPDGEVNSGDEFLSAVQHAMPGISDPYVANAAHLVEEHYGDKPFFVNFPFGYVANAVNWFEGAGVPFSAFDDAGRENPYPLVRVQATDPNANGAVMASLDTVLPISGEASCKNCHGSPLDVSGPNAGVANQALVNAGLSDLIEDSASDPLSSVGNIPAEVSVEYATDINVLRLHDFLNGGEYRNGDGALTACSGISLATPNGNANCLSNQALVQGKPVVCQVCHYTPALDLAQFGPLGGVAPGTFPQDSMANGRVQRIHMSNSRVMHYSHGLTGLFPNMPAPTEDSSATGLPGNHAQRTALVEETCYQCHPGNKTKCLRGAMADGGMVCQDCHGEMADVGDDFSADLTAINPFPTGADLTKRVPWANEPGCGSCHTGDASNNMARPGTGVAINGFDTYGNADGIRLIQAYADGNAKPIVPGNKRFAEAIVPASFNGFANPAAGSPKLYRVSTGHGGVFCEGCHGATHAEWDGDGSPLINDNVTANQLQGHSGTVSECTACHGNELDNYTGLGGPHGMHVVGANTRFADDDGHDSSPACFACHGGSSRNNSPGTVLSRAGDHRTLRFEGRTIQVAKGDPIGCITCHGTAD